MIKQNKVKEYACQNKGCKIKKHWNRNQLN